jgi:hypothetical protein
MFELKSMDGELGGLILYQDVPLLVSEKLRLQSLMSLRMRRPFDCHQLRV